MLLTGSRSKYSLLPFLLFFWALAQVHGSVTGQSSLALNIVATDFEWKDPPKTFPDSTAIVNYLQDWITRAQAKAHWEASVDSLYRTTPTTFTAVLHKGKAYAWVGLTPPEDQDIQRWLRRSGFRIRRFATNQSLQPEAWNGIRDSTLVRAADAGYPFAAIGLEDVELSEAGALSARIGLNTGPLVRIGAIRAPESVRVRPAFLQRYLGLQEGEVYRGQRVRRMGASLRQLPYLTMKGNPRITFQDSLAFIDLPLEKRAASRFDFVIGVLPNSAQTGKLLITGELNGELQNGFGQGERIAVRFEQLRPQTQELELGLEYPFLFGLPFGFEGSLDLYRRDTSFLNLNWNFSGEDLLPNEQYRIGGARLLRGFDEQSVFARDYAVLTTEFRLLLGGNAFLYGFLDAARVNSRDKRRPDLPIDYPLGFGAGINVDTRAGVFGLSLALGRSNGIPLDLNAPKVHLGYVSVF